MLNLSQKLVLVFLVSLVGAIFVTVFSAPPARSVELDFISSQETDGSPGFIEAVGVKTGIYPDGWIGLAHATSEVCITAPDMLKWLHGKPSSQPSAGVFAILKGDEAIAFLMLTSGGVLAIEDRMVYMFHAPEASQPSVKISAYAFLADKSGCIIRASGDRLSNASEQYAGVTLTGQRACDIFDAVGVIWFRCSDVTPAGFQA